MTNKKEEIGNISDELTKKMIRHLRLNINEVRYNILGIDVKNSLSKPLVKVAGKSSFNFVIYKSCGRVCRRGKSVYS